MYCSNCGNEIKEGSAFCGVCGYKAGAAVPSPDAFANGQSSLQQAVQDFGYAQPVNGYAEAETEPMRSGGFAVTALICAVLASLGGLIFFVSLPLSVAGLVCGIFGLRSRSKEMSAVATVISAVFFVLGIVSLIVIMSGAWSIFDPLESIFG